MKRQKLRNNCPKSVLAYGRDYLKKWLSLAKGALSAEVIAVFTYFLKQHTFLLQLLMDIAGTMIVALPEKATGSDTVRERLS